MATKQLTALFLAVLALASCTRKEEKIDRQALVARNNPHIESVNPLHSLNLGNGEFTVTLDATGLQTFPEFYKDGLSLGTYTEWGWHEFPNINGYRIEETLEEHPLPGHPRGVYAVQKGKGQSQRSIDAAEWFRANPQRLHLGNFGFAGMYPEEITDVDQTLDMYNGELISNFKWNGKQFSVKTVTGGESDLASASIKGEVPVAVKFRFPYPSGVHTDDASDWNADERHSTEIVSSTENTAVLKRIVDNATYYVSLSWTEGSLERSGKNEFTLTPSKAEWSFSEEFLEKEPDFPAAGFGIAELANRELWNEYWNTTGIVDFSHCTNEWAPLIEKKVILSQYLMRVQEAQNFPPAETGMTYNSWYGKYHLEMVMWHSFHYAAWNKPELLEKQLNWYLSAMPNARKIAERQGFGGVRWMKMTDPTALESPSDIGSYIIWQQPHPIYMAELIYRATKSQEHLQKYYDMVQQTARFMADFVNWDEETGRYIIIGACAANESLNEEKTINPAFELAYWHFGLSVAQQWRERMGQPRDDKWDDILNKLSPLPVSPDGIYLSAEKGPGIPDFKNGTVTIERAPAAPAGGYNNGQRPKATEIKVIRMEDIDPSADPKKSPFYVRGTSNQHLLAYGVLPMCPLISEENMTKTLERAYENWGWNGNWSWNYPTFIMNATRLHRPDIAVRAAAFNGREDLLLPSGNNYRSETLRMYLPGNGGLLFAVGLMCAGWDGCTEKNPGFPKDGTWDVRWEGLAPLP